MKFKKFNQYVKQYSRDPKSFSNQVALATNESDFDLPYFDHIKNQYDLKESFKDIPIIISESFTFDSISLNESTNFKYNMNSAPNVESVYEDFGSEEFIPNTTDDIRTLKKLKFPIYAKNKKSIDEYKTIGKLRASEKVYDSFTENPVPKTKFKVLSFKGEPIGIVETIGKFPMDVDTKRFKYMNEATEISKKMYEKYGLDFYNVNLVESSKGKIYVSSIDKKLNLNPYQAVKVYEKAYSDYYQTNIPNWVKSEIFEANVKPYCKKKFLDSKLIKSDHTIDYSRYL